MKVIHEATPGRYMLQENTGHGWDNLRAFNRAGDAIEEADESARIYPQSQFRVIDTKGETK